MVDVGLEPTIPKNHGPADDAICKGLSGVLVRLTTCKRLTNSLPKLRLMTGTRIVYSIYVELIIMVLVLAIEVQLLA